jgi:hypothetical protein
MAQSAALASQQLQKGISPGVQASGPFKKIISQSQRGYAGGSQGGGKPTSRRVKTGGKMSQSDAARAAQMSVGMMCWVARASWGDNNPRWEAFRDSMLDYAPTWFVALYAAHGEKVAKYINTPFRRSVSRCILSSLQTLWTPNVAREAHKLA